MNRIDDALLKATGRLVRLWSWTTGKSNFALARLLIYGGLAWYLVLVGALTGILVVYEAPMGLSIILPSNMLFLFFLLFSQDIRLVKRIGRAEEAIWRAKEALPWEYIILLVLARAFRVESFIIGVSLIGVGACATGTAAILLGELSDGLALASVYLPAALWHLFHDTAFYAVEHITTPPGSILAKARTKVKEFLARRQEAVPLPKPA